MEYMGGGRAKLRPERPQLRAEPKVLKPEPPSRAPETSIAPAEVVKFDLTRNRAEWAAGAITEGQLSIGEIGAELLRTHPGGSSGLSILFGKENVLNAFCQRFRAESDKGEDALNAYMNTLKDFFIKDKNDLPKIRAFIDIIKALNEDAERRNEYPWTKAILQEHYAPAHGLRRRVEKRY